jgi:outer membrane murein-binding lipoprotein Lpp
MLIRRTALALVAAVLVPAVYASGQQSPAQLDSIRAQIHTSLRAFYFNLAHQDWEALTADILAAKVVAHRPAPAALLAAAVFPSREVRVSQSNDRTACSSSAAPMVDQAVMLLDGDWAEVSVPRCNIMDGGADEFRLIHFEQRWRIVYIDLFQQPLNVTTDR